MLNQQLVSRERYGGEQELYAPFFRNMENPAEWRRQGRVMVPAQLVRTGDVGRAVTAGGADRRPVVRRFAFLSGLMFVYTDFASATPSSNNVEGLVYLQPRCTRWAVFWKVQSEAVVYGLLFGGFAAWLLF